MAPVKGGFGGFPNDISDVMQGSIYAYILCMALAYRMYHDIYIISEERTTLGGDPTRRAGKAKAIAAANSAELRSFRRGCMALQSSKDKGSKQVSTTYFCFQALGMAVPCNSREVKLRAFRLRCFFILSFQLCCLAVLCLRRSYPKCLKNKTKCWPLFSTVPPVFSSKICPKNKTECSPFSTGK